MNALNKDLQKLTQMVERDKRKQVQGDTYALKFHLMPTVGWLNDPNGLCEFNGMYHMFYQYSPFDVEGGIKFWGHYASPDMIHWENRGTALYADQPYDCHGVYSGSAFVEDGKMHLFYTGNVKEIGDYDYIHEGRGHNTVYAVSDDGITFDYKKCLMTTADYPEDLTCHVRDPKVWKVDDTYYMVQGARDKKDVGSILVFESEDMLNWTYKNRIESKEKFGYMWECPDVFVLDGETVVLLSPQGVEADGMLYQNVYQSGYYILEGDYTTEDYNLSHFVEMDRGFDFYAPQTFTDCKGRRLLVGWMGLPDIQEHYSNPTVDKGWQHALTVPRVLKVRNGKLLQMPIEELQILRGEAINYTVAKQFKVEAPETFELFIQPEESAKSFDLVIREGVGIKFVNGVITLYFKDGGYGRTERSVVVNEVRAITLLVDTSSIEVFINEGEEVFTTRYYLENRVPSVEVVTTETKLNFTLWQMEAYTVEDKFAQ